MTQSRRNRGRTTPRKATAPNVDASPSTPTIPLPGTHGTGAGTLPKGAIKATGTDAPAAIGKQHHPKVKPIIEELQNLRGSKVLTYFLAEGAAIGEDVVVHLYEHLLRLGRQDRLDLFLVSRGGATEVPWRIVTLLREFTDHLAVLVPYQAQSAATHISLGADEIVMTELSQLGPVDPSRRHPLLPEDKFTPQGQDPQPLSISVQDLRQFIQFVAADGAEEGRTLSPPDSAAIYTELMRQVHPLVIGAMEQTYTLAKQMTKSMLGLHLDPIADKDKIDALADRFADHYKTHSYPICRNEAIELGLKVTKAPDDVRDVMWKLWKHYTTQRIHIEAETAAFPGASPVKVSMDSLSYVDTELGSALGFRKVDANGKLLGGEWFAWFA
jgi:Serine dehydrogenase proteinase